MTLALTLLIGLMAHFVGDYLLQTHWMATEKTSRWLPAVLHGVTYTLPFLFATHSLAALLVIGGTHIIIDRYRLAKYPIWAKNQLAPKAHRFPLTPTGYPESTPAWLATGLLIVSDNIIHILINSAALIWL